MQSLLHHLRQRSQRALLPALGLALAFGALGLGSPATPVAWAGAPGKRDCAIATKGGYTITITHGTTVSIGGSPFTCYDGQLWADSQYLEPSVGTLPGHPLLPQAHVVSLPLVGVLSLH